MDPSHVAPANFYATPELAAHYDAEFVGRPHLPFDLALARTLGAERVADVGDGTGLLCSIVVAQGHEVIGVEAQGTMLDLARRQPHAAMVTWVQGTAEQLPPVWADLVVMTGHVAQYFLDDRAWQRVLSQCRSALRPGGHVAFEIRNAALESWRDDPRDPAVPVVGRRGPRADGIRAGRRADLGRLGPRAGHRGVTGVDRARPAGGRLNGACCRWVSARRGLPARRARRGCRRHPWGG